MSRPGLVLEKSPGILIPCKDFYLPDKCFLIAVRFSRWSKNARISVDQILFNFGETFSNLTRFLWIGLGISEFNRVIFRSVQYFLVSREIFQSLGIFLLGDKIFSGTRGFSESVKFILGPAKTFT